MNDNTHKLLRLDELNTLKSLMVSNPTEQEEEDIIDELLDFLLLAYADGKIASENDLGKPSADVSTDKLNEVIYKRIDGLTFEDRAREHIANNDINALGRLAETERHRIYNQAAFDTATELGAKFKTWVTIGDEKVRDTHDFIQNVTKPMGEKFVTSDYDEALCPGGFENPQNNINCRCRLTYSY